MSWDTYEDYGTPAPKKKRRVTNEVVSGELGPDIDLPDGAEKEVVKALQHAAHNSALWAIQQCVKTLREEAASLADPTRKDALGRIPGWVEHLPEGFGVSPDDRQDPVAVLQALSDEMVALGLTTEQALRVGALATEYAVRRMVSALTLAAGQMERDSADLNVKASIHRTAG